MLSKPREVSLIQFMPINIKEQHILTVFKSRLLRRDVKNRLDETKTIR
jgi:hypothetical protein